MTWRLPTFIGTVLAAGIALSLVQPESPAIPAPQKGDPLEALTLKNFLHSKTAPADGFDYPLGDPDAKGDYVDASGRTHTGWYVATEYLEEYELGIHPGEDWNGRGGANTDLGAAVYATAAGRVQYAGHQGQPWGNVVVLEHVYYENHHKLRLWSVYVHLGEILTTKGTQVARRQQIGTVGQDPDETLKAHLHFELRTDGSLPPNYWPSSDGHDADWIEERYESPSAFIDAHRSTPIPQSEPALVLVDKSAKEMQIFSEGIPVSPVLPTAFGQAEGDKTQRGDNRTPAGMYFVTAKSTGPFAGDYAAYYGGYWIKINYPNAFDAAGGLSEELVTAPIAKRIAEKWSQRKLTPQNTKLGSGIGFHGWISEWEPDETRALSWGCIVLQPEDIAAHYEKIPVGAMVILF